MKGRYDVIIAGGGPAGCVAARLLAEQRVSVLLCEKRDAVGVPVRCAELGGYEHEMARFVRLDDSIVVNRLDWCQAISPSGRTYGRPVSTPPLMVDRARFDQRLFAEAQEAGAECVTGAEAEGLERAPDGRVVSVRVRAGGAVETAGCDFLIAADGVESLIGRMLEIRTACPLRDIYSCCQVRVENYTGRPTAITFYVGREVAPRGYVWIFPRGDGSANVGVGQVEPGAGPVPSVLLDRFLAKNLPKARVISRMAGGIPADGGLKTFVVNNAALIGDAAHHANPFSGGGIMNGMEDAELLVTFLLKLIREGRPERLYRYHSVYFRKYGLILRLQKMARNAFYTLPDGKVDELFSAIDGGVDRENFDYPAFLRAMGLGYARMLPFFLSHARAILR